MARAADILVWQVLNGEAVDSYGARKSLKMQSNDDLTRIKSPWLIQRLDIEAFTRKDVMSEGKGDER